MWIIIHISNKTKERCKMKPVTPELKSKLIQSNAGLKKVKWNEVFDTEEELVRAMFNEKGYSGKRFFFKFMQRI